MKTTRLLPLLALPALLSLYEPGTEVRFTPAEDAEVSIAFENHVELFLDDFSAEMMGMDMGAMIGDIEMSVALDLEAAFTDTYASSADNRPVAFSRSYDGATLSGEFSAAAQGESEGDSFEVESGLEGTVVNWRWDEDEEEYTPSYPEDEEGDEDRLAGLLPRLDLAFMLPEGEVAAGDSWEIDPLELAALILPGGDLGYDTEAGDRGEFEDGFDEEELEEMMAGLFEGEVTATFKGMREDSDLAEIQVGRDTRETVVERVGRPGMGGRLRHQWITTEAHFQLVSFGSVYLLSLSTRPKGSINRTVRLHIDNFARVRGGPDSLTVIRQPRAPSTVE